MTIGTVKFYNATKGFGFIQPEDGATDVFVHATALERSNIATLSDGQKVSFESAVDDRSGKTAVTTLELA
jgi:CspA family cold shock protein